MEKLVEAVFASCVWWLGCAHLLLHLLLLFLLLLLLLDLIPRCSGEVGTLPRVTGSLNRIVRAIALMASLVSIISMVMVMVVENMALVASSDMCWVLSFINIVDF